MRKFIAIAALAIILAPTIAAQNDQLFNHISVAATLGTDGLGIEAATTISPHFQLRAGYSFFPYRYKGAPDFLPETIDIEGQSRLVRDVTRLTLKFNTGGGRLLADFFPSTSRGFHFTVGAYINKPKFIDLDIDVSKILYPEEYASYGVQINKNDYRTNVTTDLNGHLRVSYRHNVFKPYLGIGFGRAANSRRVSATFDMGIVYTGKPYIRSYDYSINKNGKPVDITSDTLQDVESLDIVYDALRLLEKIPFMPILKLNIYIKII